MTDRVVNPDYTLLKQIFPNPPVTHDIFLQSSYKCVFKAKFAGFSRVVRLEAENENLRSFTTVATMQKIGRTIIPNLVPKTFDIGTAKDAQGRMFHFSVNEFVPGDVLDDVWQRMSAKEQSSVVAELAEALEKLHSVRLSDKWVKDILNWKLRNEVKKNFEHPNAFGGPHTGFVNDGLALLESIVKPKSTVEPENSFCTLQPIVNSPDIGIQSKFRELGSIIVNNSDMDKWPGEAVLCHNDLNPNNLILQRRACSDGKSEYKLAGIIDWEFAGFYPASYELSKQDAYLGCTNRQLSFYLLLKERMKAIVPRSSSQIALLQAMELIFESKQRMLADAFDIVALIRNRFMGMAKLTRDNDPYVGWTISP
jgi:serine/threonine protein kinase